MIRTLNVYHCPAREILKFYFAAVLFWPVALLHQWFRVKVPLQRGLEPDELDLGCSQLLPETGELTLSEPPQVLTIPGKTLCLVQRLPPESLQKWSVDEMFIVLDYWWRHMTLIEPLQSKEVHWSEPLMFIIAPQGRFWSFTSPQYYFGLLPYCTNDSEWRFLTAGTGAWWIGFGVPIVTRDRRADPFRTTLSIFTFSFQHKQKKTDLIWIVFRRLLKLLQKVSCLRCGVPC